MDDYKIISIEEGLTKIEFPEYEKVSSDAPVFYNPHMELNRDLSILAIQVFQEEQERDYNRTQIQNQRHDVQPLQSQRRESTRRN